MPTQTMPASTPYEPYGSYGALLGIKQQQQTLQTGAALQETAQHEAKIREAQQWQEQQKTREMQFMAIKAPQLMQDPNAFDENHVLKADYIASQLSPGMPTTWPEVAQHVYQAQEAGIKVNQEAQKFNDQIRNAAYTTVAGAAMSPDFSQNITKASDYADWLDNVKKQLPENARGMVDLVTANIKPPPNDRPWTPQEVQHLQTDLEVGARPMLPAGEQSGPGGLVTPKAATIDQGSRVLSGTVAPVVGPNPGGFVAQTGVQKTLAPTDLPGYKREVAAASTAGSTGAQSDQALYNTIVNEGTKATQIKSLSQDVQHFAKEVQTGEYSKQFANKWAVAAQTLGLSPENMTSATRRQILSKMSAQLKMQSEAGAATDNERSGIEAAMPDPEHMTPQAVQQAARYVGAQADVKAARAQVANIHRQLNGGTSNGLQGADLQFMQNADPRLFEYQSIPAGKERQEYLKSHFSNAAEVKDFLEKQKQLKAYGALK